MQGNCLGIKNPDIESGTKVTVVSLDDPQRAVSATVLDQVSTDQNCTPLLADRRAVNLGNGYSFYVLEAATEIQSGIGLLGDGVKIDEYRFDSCTTGEGIRYRLQGKHSSRQTLLWSGYYYLGYDSEASCTEQP